MIQECVPCLVSLEENHSLTSVPTEAEIKTAIFDMNGDGAPGPDGCGGALLSTLLGYSGF
jgi:hypothetical protein